MSHLELIDIKVPNKSWLECVTRGDKGYVSTAKAMTVLNSRAAILSTIAPAPS